ncbi:hypothetical protein Q8W71_11330 [Methylobacterium sp. NEAU 140]|uniref:hypothetical protein n=1 Tax=Methylobacterium sp. NEAU 140 TaxID=3064945 RepID=UPI00273656A8|nr:hypothetical protein [Methylobacterium sp. NEAU 140]MDP4023219.1 hypothetical protein [Methylobacterium sp. NEAU 140]
MLDRGERETRPFGRRRPPGDGPVPEPVPAAASEPRPAGALLWALRTAALVGFAGVLAAQYLVRITGPGEVAATRVAATRVLNAEPETTGSLARAAPRPDPCAVAPGARHP